MNTIFWDFDGTLVHSPKMWTKCLMKALRETTDTDLTFERLRDFTRRGYPWDRPYLDNRGLTKGRFWEYMESRYENGLVELGFSLKTAQTAAKRVRSHILDEENYKLYPDTIKVLEGFKERGCKSYIISNNYPELKEVMDKIGLLKYFEGLAVSGEIGWDKPNKEIFDYALSLAGMPKKAYMVGDNPIADILGGKRAGLTTILVHKNADHNGDYMCSNLIELFDIIK